MVSVRAFSLCGILLTFWGVPVSLLDVPPCYDEFKRPQMCFPDFENPAFGKPVEATNTCGTTSGVEYCWLNAFGTGAKNCSVCRDRVSDGHRFSTSVITDGNDSTWWQSETMVEDVHEKTVNLTLHLKKAFYITYLFLKFLSPRPESFAIFKRTGEDGPWVPFQFYSASCESTYGVQDRTTATNIQAATCTSFYSDISPLTGGRTSFSSLEGRSWGMHRTNDIEVIRIVA